MTRHDYLGFVILTICIAAGIYIKGFPGGCLVGSCTSILLFVSLGKYLANKTKKKIDASTEAIRRNFEDQQNKN